MSHEAFPVQWFEEREAKERSKQDNSRVVAPLKVTTLAITNREALDPGYKLYLTNRGHKDLIQFYEQAADYNHQIKNSRSTEHKRSSQYNYNEALKKIFQYEVKHELLDIRDEYVFGQGLSLPF